MDVTVKLQPRIVKYPKDMKMAYMKQEADLDNTKTAFEDETKKNERRVNLAVSLDGGTPHFTPQVMIIFSRKTPWVVGETHHFRKPPYRWGQPESWC